MAKTDVKEVDLTFDDSKYKQPFLETSTFEVMYPKHRTEYLKSIEQYAIKACENKKILLEIDYEATTLKISTTKKTRDPYIILKGYELIQLIAKSFLLEHALKVLEDGYTSEIIPVRMLCASENIYERRRGRLLNPKVLKSLELISKCHIVVTNKTACILGSYKGVAMAKRVILSCFDNVHPAYELKRLIIKNKLLDENKEGDWDHLLPKIKKTHSKIKKVSRPTGGMPEEIKDRKADEEMQTGEFFMKEKNIEKIQKREDSKKRREDRIKKREQRHEILDE